MGYGSVTNRGSHDAPCPRRSSGGRERLGQDRGLVERRPDPQDRRATLVAPTDEGTRVGQAIRASGDAEAEAYFSVLSEAERKDLTGILRKLRR